MVRVRYSFGSRHTGNLKNIRKQRQKYPKIVLDVIEISDIILEVLDARFIEETRNLELEKLIREKGKKIIYVLNKADLINKEDIKKKIKIKPYVFISCTQRKGGFNLRNLIKRVINEIDLDGKKRAQVGIIGYPNTGKSSLINFLTGRNVAKKGNEPGFTKGMQKVRLTQNILILDTPGVISNEDYSMYDNIKISKHAKIGSRSIGKIREPEVVIQNLLNEHKEKLEKSYEVKSKGDSEFFLEQVGKKKNYLTKGGEVDITRTALQVIKEWQDGKFKF
ncbi:MAG: GTPase [Candidatus Pacearchaeota archaeon]